MEYKLFDDEFWEAFKKFDEVSKKFIGQCYYEENLKNGKEVRNAGKQIKRIKQKKAY